MGEKMIVGNIIKYLYPKRSIKRKILEITDDIKRIVSGEISEPCWILWYGAYNIDPKNLAIWICVTTDETKSKLKSNIDLIHNLRPVFDHHSYPQQAIPFVTINFESEETVQRESNGNWWNHLR